MNVSGKSASSLLKDYLLYFFTELLHHKVLLMYLFFLNYYEPKEIDNDASCMYCPSNLQCIVGGVEKQVTVEIGMLILVT